MDFSTAEPGAMEIRECGPIPTVLHHLLKLVMVCKCKVGYFHFFFSFGFWMTPKVRVITPKFSYQNLAYLA